MRTTDRYLLVLAAGFLAEAVILAEATDTTRAAWPVIGALGAALTLTVVLVLLLARLTGMAFRRGRRRTVPAEQMKAEHITPPRYARRPTRLDASRAREAAAAAVDAPVEPRPAELAEFAARAAAAVPVEEPTYESTLAAWAASEEAVAA